MLTLATILLLAPFSHEFTMHRAIDSSTGETAYRYLLPQGWTSTDQVTWELTNKIRPMSFKSTLTSSDGTMSISILPAETTIFQVSNGQLSGTLPPETATKALDNVLAVSHPGLTNATLVVRKDFDVPTPLDGQGMKTKGMVGILEVSFQQNGQQMTELLSATEYEGSHTGDGGLVQGVWMMTAGYTLTVQGQMTEDEFKTFASVSASNRPDPIFFGTMMEVSKQQQQSGTIDLQAVAKSVKSLSAESKPIYDQNVALHNQSIAKMFPVFPGLAEVVTPEGPMTSFKGEHVWMKKPNAYQVSEAAEAPGDGWISAKDSA